jgi:hypothetical protein
MRLFYVHIADDDDSWPRDFTCPVCSQDVVFQYVCGRCRKKHPGCATNKDDEDEDNEDVPV